MGKAGCDVDDTHQQRDVFMWGPRCQREILANWAPKHTGGRG